jgi:hypothetical protein
MGVSRPTLPVPILRPSSISQTSPVARPVETDLDIELSAPSLSDPEVISAAAVAAT